jgi:Ca2+:H+ antiporter
VFIALVSEVFVESVQVAAENMGMTPAFVGFVVVSLVGGAAEMMTAFSAAAKNRVDLSVSIAMGSSAQIALFVAPVLVLASYWVAPVPMDLVFLPGQVLMVMLSTLSVAFLAAIGRSTWFVGVQLIAVYLIFAVSLYLLPAT